MATLWIREYRFSGVAEGGRMVPIPREPGTDQTPVTYTISAQSAAFASTTRYVRCISDYSFHYLVAADPTATTSHLKWPADTPLDIAVPAGQKIAAVLAAS